MVSPISSLDLRYYLPVEAVRLIKPVERREEEQITPISSETKDRGDGSKSRGNTLRVLVEDERKALAQISPIRPNLSPSDELALFGDSPEQASLTANQEKPTPKIDVGQAISDTGEEIAVESIAPQLIVSPAEQALQDEKVVALNAQAQIKAARAYARNNDIVFANAPATQLAA